MTERVDKYEKAARIKQRSRTSKDLAKALTVRARFCDPIHKPLCDEIARRLDAMPEGERIEGSIYDDYPMGDTYIFKARSAKQDERPATLTIRKRKEAPR